MLVFLVKPKLNHFLLRERERERERDFVTLKIFTKVQGHVLLLEMISRMLPDFVLKGFWYIV